MDFEQHADVAAPVWMSPETAFSQVSRSLLGEEAPSSSRLTVERKRMQTTRPPKRRSQFHSCDQCRRSKRACNLSQSQSPCLTCITRDLDCTSEWLDQRSAHATHADPSPSSFARKKRRENAPGMDAVSGHPAHDQPLLMINESLSQALLSQAIVARKFRVFLIAYEFPLSHWLAEECNPHSSLLLGGIKAVPLPGQVTNHGGRFHATMQKVYQGVASYQLYTDASLSLPPRFIYALAALDMLLGDKLRLRSRSVISMEKRLADESAIGNAIKWTIVASASQFNAFTSPATPSQDGTRYGIPFLATDTWHKARKQLFDCMSLQSFRLSFALILFGLSSIPVQGQGDQSEMGQQLSEDAAFALRQGLERMGDLCFRARHMLPAWAEEGREPTLAATAAAAVVESMLGSIEWLLVMVKSVVILTDTDMARVLAPDASILGRSELADLLLVQEEDRTVELSVTSMSTTIWESIVMQSLYDRSTKQAISSSLSQSVIQAILRRASSLKVVLWKAVGDLYALKRSRPICNASVKTGYRLTLGLIQLWHQTYGDLCTHLVGSTAIPSAVTQSMFAFVSNHVNLAVLHFIGCIEEEEDQEMQASSWTKELRLFWEPFRSLHHEMKRSSAMSIARVSALESGGYLTADLAENNAPDKDGIVACLPLGLWCHPVSAVSCRAGLLA